MCKIDFLGNGVCSSGLEKHFVSFYPQGRMILYEAITVTYSHDLSPISEPKMPDYVLMPNTKEEIASLVKLFRKNNIPYTMRGNGQNLLGFAVSCSGNRR